MVVRVMMLTGQSLDHVINLDVLTFNALCSTLNRVYYRTKLQDAWVMAAATSVGMTGDKKALDSIAEAWEDVTELEKIRKVPMTYNPKKAAQGQSAFLQALRGGGMKGGKF